MKIDFFLAKFGGLETNDFPGIRKYLHRMIGFLETPSQIWGVWGEPSFSFIFFPPHKVMQMWTGRRIVIGFLETASLGLGQI